MHNYEFNKDNWKKMTIYEQMGNIGADVKRAQMAKDKSDLVAMQAALFRGLDLIDYTVSLYVHKKASVVRELLLVREVFAGSILKNENYPGLENYFLFFALAARSNR